MTVTFSVSFHQISKIHALVQPLRILIAQYAPRIQELEISEYFAQESLLPMSFGFLVLETVRVSYFSEDSGNPDHIFSIPTIVKSLQLRGQFLDPDEGGNVLHPLRNIDSAHLKTLEVCKDTYDGDFDIFTDLPNYSVRHLELPQLAFLHGSSNVVPMALRSLSSLILRDSSVSFCKYFSSLPRLSHLTLSPQSAVPTTLLWPSMPCLTTLTLYRVHANDVLAAVSKCPMLVAIHYEIRWGFVTFLDGLYHIIISKCRGEPSRDASYAPQDGPVALKYLRLGAISAKWKRDAESLRPVVGRVAKLFEVWPQGQLALIAHHSHKLDVVQWDEEEVAEAIGQLRATESNVKMLLGASRSEGSGLPLLSDMF
ncbi:hypothetical protein DL93DRAFT_2159487 [Clavulina sp. PMI_390]|nr:hypothetical protein DL93DRAFT_2159487 [Clavulina sp. PMI_390]